MAHQTTLPDTDIAIVGGGISGAAIGYGLVRAGHRVVIIDAPTDTNKASRTNVGLIWCQSKFQHLPDYARLAFLSAALFPELLAELEELTGIHVPVSLQGGIIPCLGEEEFTRRGDYIDKLRQTLGEYPGEMIDRATLEKKLPKIDFGPEVTGAAWGDKDGIIEPLVLLRAFRAGFIKLGGTLIPSHVHDVQPTGSGYAIATARGTMCCNRLVLAAGLANRRFTRFAVKRLPVSADKGQVLLVERMPWVMPMPVLGVSQTFGGTTIIGFRHEFVGQDTHLVAKDVATEGAWAMRVWPELARKRLIRAWCGLRVMPEDKQAIYSTLPGHPKATLINTHSAITLAAFHSRELPGFITDGNLPELCRGMTLARFGITDEATQ